MLKLRYDLSIWESAMFGGGDDPALNFDGTSIYGELTHPSISTGDFEHTITFKTTDTLCSLLGTGATHLANRLQPFINGSGILVIYHAGPPIVQTLAAVNDGLEHTAVVERTGSAWSLTLDGIPQDTGTGTGTVTVDRVGNNNGSQWYEGQIKLIKFIDKSGASDVIQTYQINNGSTTSIPIAGGGPEAMTLYNVVGGDWS